MRTRIHRYVFYFLLALLGVGMTTSVWLANLAWVMLGVNWVIEGRWREKWQMLSPLLVAVLGMMGLYVVGLIWSSHLDTAMGVLQVKLPLMVLPLVLLTTRPPTQRWRTAILALYVATVVVVSVVSVVRLHTIGGLPYREAVPHISHIRFVLNCCVVLFLCVSAQGQQIAVAWRVLLAAVAVWMVAVILLLRSYTGLVVLAVVPPVVLLLRWRSVGRLARPMALAWLLLVMGVGGAVGYYAYSYFHLTPQARGPYAPYTANGNPYTHQQGIVENGNYIGCYVCRSELEKQWPTVSRVPLDYQPNGYSVCSALLRYLNALGYTKDSAGIAQLTPIQVAEIECGEANPVYRHGNSLRKMVYVMCFEYECNRHTNAVLDFSMLQRFEQWRATWRVVKAHPWLGTGTGDLRHELDAQLCANASPMMGKHLTPHNQYLSFLAMFGVLGFVVIVLLFLRAIPQVRTWPVWMLAWGVTVLLSFLTEDTLNTLMGILFCTFFLAFQHDKPAKNN